MSALESLVASMTLDELARRAGRSVEEVVAIVLDGQVRSNGVKSSPMPPSVHSSAARASTVPRGGLRLDRVLATLASTGGPAKADDVRAKVGGSVAQVRAALKKLAKSGKVQITGERRGTRYVAC